MSNPTAPQPPKAISWAEKVRVSDSSTRCHLDHLPRQPTGSILRIPENMILANVDKWKNSMVGFFVSYKMPYHAVCSIANRVWKEHGLEKVSVLDNGFMVFRFASEEGMKEVLAKGPWMFGGKSILLQQWQPGFKFDKNKIRHLPVWARLQGLPFPLWNKQGLSMAASMIGKPIACDEATIQCNRLEYARICIELDANIPLVHQFQVTSSLSEDPITVDVLYEWKPARCQSCRVFGHTCKNKETTVQDQGPRLEKEGDCIVPEAPKSDKEHHTGMNHLVQNSTSQGEDLQLVKENERCTKELCPRIQDKGESSLAVSSEGANAKGKGKEPVDKGIRRELTSNLKEKGGKTGSMDSLPQSIDSRMGSLSGDGDSKELYNEVSGSSTSECPPLTHKGPNSPSPKAKKRKGKKKKGAGSPW
ncbi:hypothetical protein DKX38_010007 [Salix brachista]|uniref:DUF4283 domain-containing protein n=1 Tax=Salix brachista TaxID=2182728 RepID=A0A5N5MF02_9ROSI|nr:hypothetical protein DKX38_010007 [Salix brachista]